jgi:hypothetical protein
MMTNSAFNQILSLLDALNEDEQLQLINTISDRLRGVIQEYAADTEEDEPETTKGREYKPRLANMLQWGVLQINDRLYVEGHEDQAALLLNKNEVAYDGRVMRINDWAKMITDWQSISIYRHVIVDRLGKTLGEVRQEYMDQHGLE